MKEFVEKLIGRLEESAQGSKDSKDLSKYSAYKQSIEIINQLAEEYQSRVMIDKQYCWQNCLATEMCNKCNRLCNGSIDYFEPLCCYEYEDEGGSK